MSLNDRLEDLGFELSTAMEKDNAFFVGWNVGNDADVLAEIEVSNRARYDACKARKLAALRKT